MALTACWTPADDTTVADLFGPVVAAEDGTVLRHTTEYSFKILQPVHVLDFDTARKAYLTNLKH